MKKLKITQELQVFYVLYKHFKEDRERWVSALEFVGEMYIKELGIWTLMSYKTPANGVSIFFNNPGLIERRKVEGKSGAKYFQYCFSPLVSPALIKDEKLLKFYNLIKTKKEEV